jgi:hypothetical protein
MTTATPATKPHNGRPGCAHCDTARGACSPAHTDPETMRALAALYGGPIGYRLPVGRSEDDDSDRGGATSTRYA